jgi:hypothetical protein
MPPKAAVNPNNVSADEAREQETAIWNSVHKLNENGFIDLVTQTWRFIPDWAERTYRWVKNRPKENLPDEYFGFRINFADMHRMHMRQLQAKLIVIAISLQFEKDKQKWNAVARSLQSILRQYGTATLTLHSGIVHRD